jgi:hypothetical protein
LVAKSLLLIGNTPKDTLESDRDFAANVIMKQVENQNLLSELYNRWILSKAQLEEVKKSDSQVNASTKKDTKVVRLNCLLYEANEEAQHFSNLILGLHEFLKKNQKVISQQEGKLKDLSEKSKEESSKHTSTLQTL